MPGVYLDFLTGEGVWSQCLGRRGGNRPNPFCECAIVGLRVAFYIVMRDVNMTAIDKTHDIA